jgi:broad specificity phosphatase PhoE
MNDIETTIFLSRHGQTKWNLSNRFQGNKDSPLTEIGIKQANDLKASLNGKNIHVAYSSPLKRALDTVKIITSGTPIKVIERDGLREINLGPWEGKTRKETQLSYPVEFSDFWNQPEQYLLFGAETYEELQERVVCEIKSIFLDNPGKNILVVSHWIAIKVVIAYFSGKNLSYLPEIFDINNGQFLKIVKQHEIFQLHCGENKI